jgi:hypothetical protein
MSRSNQASTISDGVHASIAPKPIACKVVISATLGIPTPEVTEFTISKRNFCSKRAIVRAAISFCPFYFRCLFRLLLRNIPHDSSATALVERYIPCGATSDAVQRKVKPRRFTPAGLVVTLPPEPPRVSGQPLAVPLPYLAHAGLAISALTASSTAAAMARCSSFGRMLEFAQSQSVSSRTQVVRAARPAGVTGRVRTTAR